MIQPGQALLHYRIAEKIGEGGLTAVRVELGQNVVVDMPQRLFPTRAGNTWDSAPDGERFIPRVPDDPTEDYPITLVVNWNGSR